MNFNKYAAFLVVLGFTFSSHANICDSKPEGLKVFCSLFEEEPKQDYIQLLNKANWGTNDDASPPKGLGLVYHSYLNKRLNVLFSETVRTLIMFEGELAEDYMKTTYELKAELILKSEDSTIFVFESPLSALLEISNDPKLLVMTPDAPLGPNPAVTIKN